MLEDLLHLGFTKIYTVNLIEIYRWGNWQIGIREGNLVEVYLGTLNLSNRFVDLKTFVVSFKQTLENYRPNPYDVYGE